MSEFERGFKSRSEALALSFRKRVDSKPHEPLPVGATASVLAVRVFSLKKLQDLGIEPEATKWLLNNGKQEWSAVTIFDQSAVVVVYNSTHSESRLRSDLAHEFAHIILGHKPNRVTLSQSSDMAIRTFDVRQESEAEWLAGCLLAPRDGLFWCLQRGLNRQQIVDQLGISLAMVDYRLKVTGLTRQFAGHFLDPRTKGTQAR